MGSETDRLDPFEELKGGKTGGPPFFLPFDPSKKRFGGVIKEKRFLQREFHRLIWTVKIGILIHTRKYLTLFGLETGQSTRPATFPPAGNYLCRKLYFKKAA
jgi:hypothetical protein